MPVVASAREVPARKCPERMKRDMHTRKRTCAARHASVRARAPTLALKAEPRRGMVQVRGWVERHRRAEGDVVDESLVQLLLPLAGTHGGAQRLPSPGETGRGSTAQARAQVGGLHALGRPW